MEELAKRKYRGAGGAGVRSLGAGCGVGGGGGDGNIWSTGREWLWLEGLSFHSNKRTREE